MEHLDELKLSMFIKGEIEEKEYEEILSHLEVCEECRKKYQTILFLKGFSNKLEGDEKFKKWRLFYLIAASVIVILAFSLFLTSLIMKNKYEKSYLALVEKNNFPYSKTVVRENGINNEFEKIMGLYEDGKYKEFTVKMKECIKVDKEKKALGSFYLGVAYYQLKDYKNAEKYLKTSATNFTPTFYPERFWYLANALVMEGKFSEAKKILRSLSSFNNPYSERSRRLLKAIE